MKRLITVGKLNPLNVFSWIKSITEKDPGIQKSQHTEAHVKQGDHVEIESDETKKQTRNNENCKTVDHVKKGTNNESSKVHLQWKHLMYG